MNYYKISFRLNKLKLAFCIDTEADLRKVGLMTIEDFKN